MTSDQAARRREFIVGTQVEILGKPKLEGESSEPGYDVVWPIGPGDRAEWTDEIDTIFLKGVPRALRENGRVYLLQGKDIFWSAPVQEILTDSNRISWITGEAHGKGPCLIVGRGKRHRLDATQIPPAPQELWHNRQGFKYVTPGCRAVVRVGPRIPKGAMKSRSSAEVALEHALKKHLPVDARARRIRVDDGGFRPVTEVDICIPALRLVVEYDGGYWHSGAASLITDTRKSDRLRAAGLRVIRVREDLQPIDQNWDVAIDREATPDDIARAVLEVL